jgi:hypothetical protein
MSKGSSWRPKLVSEWSSVPKPELLRRLGLESSFAKCSKYDFIKAGPVSKAEFLAMGLVGVQIGCDYYSGKYNTLGGGSSTL